MLKWLFFDVGSTLVDETEAYDHRVREMIAGTNITFKEFDDVRIALARQGLDGNSAAIKHFGLTKTPWHSEDEVPYSDAHSTLAALVDKGYKLGIIANQKLGTTEQVNALLSQLGAAMLDVDVLKVGHHGSDTSTTDAFLAAVSPEIAIISSNPKGNTFGHPKLETVNKLTAIGATIYRTDTLGDIVLIFDGTNITFEQ